MRKVRLAKWQKYKQIISDFMDSDASRKPIQYLKRIALPNLFGEDSGDTYIEKELLVLIQDNSYRTWPLNPTSISGELDNQNVAIWVSKTYLEKEGLINEAGYFDIDVSEDRFRIDGIIYKPSGDTAVSQASDETLLFMIILKRDKDDSNKINILQND
jgi:hypothetical protein